MSEADNNELQKKPAGGKVPTETPKRNSSTEPDERTEVIVDTGHVKPENEPQEQSPAQSEQASPDALKEVPNSETVEDSSAQAEDAAGALAESVPIPQKTSDENEVNGTAENPQKTSDENEVNGTAENPQKTSDKNEDADTADATQNKIETTSGKKAPAVLEPEDESADAASPAQVELQPEKTVESSEDPDTDSNEDPDDDAEEADIDKTIAEDAEDTENQRRHHIPFLDYHSLSMENLVGELQRLLRAEKVQSIRRHVEAIRREFNQKFQAFIEEKKEEFIGRGGEDSDFSYNSVTKRQFNELYSEYREKRSQYYKNLEKQLDENLQERLIIIEDLKGLVNVEEDMNSTYKSFKEIQERWKKAGPVPRANYNDVWRTYQHHLEIFYDFLSLNRELRDLDFKYNLEEKEKLSARAEALLQEEDINKAFRELQILHKIWKEDIGPVAKEHREAIWEKFSEATRKMHERRQRHFQELDKRYEGNLEEKQKIIARIEEVSNTVAKNHKGIQKQIREIETLRDQFFKAGKVPQKDNEATWASFKGAVRNFNRSKNAFYKTLKKEQQENLDLKRALLKQAIALKDSEDWDTATSEMKKIQREWKEIGHVPRKYSDAIWKEFKTACNHYFDRLHSNKNSAFAEEKKNLELKSKLLDELRGFQLEGNREKDLKTLQDYIGKWKAVGHVPRNRKHITSKFNKILDALFRKLDVGKQEAEILKYGDRIADLAKEEDSRAIAQERQFVRKKIEEVKGEIRQLENNLNFFSEPSEDNPLVKEVLQNLEKKKKGLENWNAKLKKLNILRNSLNNDEKSPDESNSEASENTD
ncbi:DUF349 domain-containing protein [Robiginitalea aurantiaca]|uniref:DUF349 domain-containing protein n=1 Tax=Robiginitalea aurantiaca TaxID=3056915 RepID=A0ABT7WGH7_9FLAO|nr:DUF349 domain-containing protein [Robiginitalea aurantiaca]MDM9632027.1 DUF349 domain-containing protein [Robiginitalea aurantiaca]